MASDGNGYPRSRPVDDSRLLYDVPTDDPEWSRPMPPSFILLAGVSCKCLIRVGGPVELATGAKVEAPLEEECCGWVWPQV